MYFIKFKEGLKCSISVVLKLVENEGLL